MIPFFFGSAGTDDQTSAGRKWRDGGTLCTDNNTGEYDQWV